MTMMKRIAVLNVAGYFNMMLDKLLKWTSKIAQSSNPWPELMLSPHVEAIIAEQKELQYIYKKWQE
jgi:hypothetical protein